jgi:monooxygenase
MAWNDDRVSIDHVDVLIVGAGLSGVGAGHQLRAKFPGKTYAILEARHELGGTWSLFTYPGVRSDSDMHTLGFKFRPWNQARAMVDGPSILSYLRDVAREGDVERHIRFGVRVVRAAWSTETATWTVTAENVETGELTELTCGFLFMCSGYYRYDEGFTPDFPGRERFTGPVVHPQHWPADLDYTDKRVVVIGSGATAVTLVPAMAPDAAHVTMLQRSPSYLVALPRTDVIADLLLRHLPDRIACSMIRWKNVLFTVGSYQLSQRAPKVMKAIIRKAQEKQLPADFDIDTHLSPRYKPWDERVCALPDGDMFAALSDGSASIVTDTIETFTETGLRLGSGAELEADIIVTATGLNILFFGGAEISVDGEVVDPAHHMTYKSMMLSDVPNFAFAFGYTNASWTLKIDLTYDYLWRLLEHMDATGTQWCVARRDPSVAERPFTEFQPGYFRRAHDKFPVSGDHAPWKLRMNYLFDVLTLGRGDVEDGTMEFGTATHAAQEAPTAAVS